VTVAETGPAVTVAEHVSSETPVSPPAFRLEEEEEEEEEEEAITISVNKTATILPAASHGDVPVTVIMKTPRASCFSFDIHHNHIIYYQIFGMRHWGPSEWDGPYPKNLIDRLKVHLYANTAPSILGYWGGRDSVTKEPFVLIKTRNIGKQHSVEQSIRYSGGPKHTVCHNPEGLGRLETIGTLVDMSYGPWKIFRGDKSPYYLGETCVGVRGNGKGCRG